MRILIDGFRNGQLSQRNQISRKRATCDLERMYMYMYICICTCIYHRVRTRKPYVHRPVSTLTSVFFDRYEFSRLASKRESENRTLHA